MLFVRRHGVNDLFNRCTNDKWKFIFGYIPRTSLYSSTRHWRSSSILLGSSRGLWLCYCWWVHFRWWLLLLLRGCGGSNSRWRSSRSFCTRNNRGSTLTFYVSDILKSLKLLNNFLHIPRRLPS